MAKTIVMDVDEVCNMRIGAFCPNSLTCFTNSAYYLQTFLASSPLAVDNPKVYNGD